MPIGTKMPLPKVSASVAGLFKNFGQSGEGGIQNFGRRNNPIAYTNPSARHQEPHMLYLALCPATWSPHLGPSDVGAGHDNSP